jgi:hypothetical protein
VSVLGNWSDGGNGSDTGKEEERVDGKERKGGGQTPLERWGWDGWSWRRY